MVIKTLSNIGDAIGSGLKKFGINHKAQRQINRIVKEGADDAAEVVADIAKEANKSTSEITKGVEKRKKMRNAINEARYSSNNASSATQEAINRKSQRQPIKNYEENTSFLIGGNSYQVTGSGKNKTYQMKTGDEWVDINSKDYGKARGEYIAENRKLADDLAKTQVGENSGILDWMYDNQLIVAGGLVAGGLLLTND